MAKNPNKNAKNAYEVRRKRIISIVCIVLAAMFLIWTVAGTMLFTFGAETDASSEETQVPPQTITVASEMRGIWVTTVGNLDYPTTPSVSPESLKSQADTVIHDCYEMGMNTIFLQVRPASDAFYPSEYYPWSRYLTGSQGTAPENGFDPLAYWVEKAHERGIELHAWINPYRITTTASDWNRLTDDHPAKAAYNDYVIKYNGNYYFDPGRPEVRNLITASAVEIVNNYNIDGIHFDDYFYPDPASGVSFNDSASYELYGAGMDKAEWRRENVNQLIREVNDAVHNADSHCVFGVSPMGVWANAPGSSLGSATRGGESYSLRYADSYTWVKNQWVDYIAPQIYWKIGYAPADYQVLVNWWSNVVNGTNVKLYIGMADYRVTQSSSDWNGSSEILRQLQLNDSGPGVSGEIHFRYKSAAGVASLYNLYKNVYASNRVPADTDPAESPSVLNLYDIAGHWAEASIRELISAGVIAGMGDGTFRPNALVTRAQFVKMLAAGTGAANYEDLPGTGFEDVNPQGWYVGPIRWAAANGVVSGRTSTIFAPDEQISREEMAKMLANYCSTFLPSDSQLDSDARGTEPSSPYFADEGGISEWAFNAVLEVVQRGIMNGVQEQDGVYFYPQRKTTRAEAAKVICELRRLTDQKTENEKEQI